MGAIAKAITALLSNTVILGTAFGLDLTWLTPEMAAAVATLLTTILVYAVPNKPSGTPTINKLMVMLTMSLFLFVGCGTANHGPPQLMEALTWDEAINKLHEYEDRGLIDEEEEDRVEHIIFIHRVGESGLRCYVIQEEDEPTCLDSPEHAMLTALTMIRQFLEEQ